MQAWGELSRLADLSKLAELSRLQDGVISRAQLLALGLTPAIARAPVDGGRWQRLFPGVYSTFTGPVSYRHLVWAGVLYAGADAAAGDETALWLLGVLDQPPRLVHICIPAARRVRAQPGLRIHLRQRLTSEIHPAATPPRIRVEAAALAVTARAPTPDSALDVIFRVTQRRLTTAARLRAALEQRPRHRWRRLLMDILSDVENGTASALEHCYARDVERAHGLPRGERNQPELRVDPTMPPGRVQTCYCDVRYRRWQLVVELDGRETHPLAETFRDRARDNRAAMNGETPLRYGWREVSGQCCGVAGQVAYLLRARGWTGQLRRCSPTCTLPLDQLLRP